MKPCDCKDAQDLKRLNEQGISINNNRLMVEPNYVKIQLGNCSFQISQSLFEKFARWYLEDQPQGDQV